MINKIINKKVLLNAILMITSLCMAQTSFADDDRRGYWIRYHGNDCDPKIVFKYKNSDCDDTEESLVANQTIRILKPWLRQDCVLDTITVTGADQKDITLDNIHRISPDPVITVTDDDENESFEIEIN